MVDHWGKFKEFMSVQDEENATVTAIQQQLKNDRELILLMAFFKENSTVAFEEMERSQVRTAGTFKVHQPLRPHIHRTWNILDRVRFKLNGQLGSLGQKTTALLKAETDGRRWFGPDMQLKLKAVLSAAIKKCDKYLTLLSFAKSARLFDPRQRPKLDTNISAYVTNVVEGKVVHRVIPQSDREGIEKSEWSKYWELPTVPDGPIDLCGWWVGVKAELPNLSTLALRTLPIPHTGVDVERSFSYYRMSRNALQSRLLPEHHIGRLSFRMNGIVPSISE